MRIAFLADPLDRQYGGIHIYTKELLLALSKLDKKNQYLIIRSKPGGAFEGMEELVVPYRNFPGYRVWRLLVELPRLIAKRDIDLVIEPAHFGPLNLHKRIKRVTVIHDLTMFLFPADHLFVSRFLQHLLLPRILKRTDHIITNSENTSKDLNQFLPFTKNKTTSILLGKNQRFQPNENKNILMKHKISPCYLLHIGTLEPRKNLITLIKAFNKFKKASPKPHQLVLVGQKGWKSKGIFDTIEQSEFKNDILQLGYVAKEDLPTLYSMATVFVYPSKYEGFGLPVLEAMACGTPVITSNTSSLPEVGGKAAKYVAPDSIEALSEKLIELCADENLRAKMSKEGLKQAALFSWKKTAQETITVFEKIVE